MTAEPKHSTQHLHRYEERTEEMSVSETDKGASGTPEDIQMEEPVDAKNDGATETSAGDPGDKNDKTTPPATSEEPETAPSASASASPAPPKLAATPRPQVQLDVAEEYLDFEQQLMRQGIAKVLKGRKIPTTTDAFSGIADLAEQYMDEVCTRLVKYTRVQRRKQPNKADLRLVMQECGIRTGELEQEMDECREWPVQPLGLSELGSLPRDEQADYYTRYFDARVIPTRQNNKLATYQNPRGDYNAPWLPSFPPDHTYLATPRFTSEIPNPRVLRQRLVAEGSMAEKALRNLAWTVQVDQAMVVHIDESDLDKLEDRLEVKVESGSEVFSLLDKDVKKESFSLGSALSDKLKTEFPGGSGPEEPMAKPILKLSIKKDTDPDPFGLEKPLRPFNVKEYAEKRGSKRSRWNDDGTPIPATNGRAGAYGSDEVETEPTLDEECPSMVSEMEQRKRVSLDQQYAMALYSIQKLGERRRYGSSATADIGVVNWRNDRYIK